MTDIHASEMDVASRAPPVEPILERSQKSETSLEARSRGASGVACWTFDAVYQAHATFVWRMVLRLGVPHAVAEDVMQDVFLVVYRRLPEFEERTSVRAWLSAIAIRVVRAHRRTARRKGPTSEGHAPVVDPDTLADARTRTAVDLVHQGEAVRELYAVLSLMKEERREALVLAELEQLTAPEIAKALQVNVNTVYWRLRRARKEFERILFCRRAAASGSGR